MNNIPADLYYALPIIKHHYGEDSQIILPEDQYSYYDVLVRVPIKVEGEHYHHDEQLYYYDVAIECKHRPNYKGTSLMSTGIGIDSVKYMHLVQLLKYKEVHGVNVLFTFGGDGTYLLIPTSKFIKVDHTIDKTVDSRTTAKGAKYQKQVVFNCWNYTEKNLRKMI